MWEKEKLLVMKNSPFPTVFSKDLYSRHLKTRAHIWERVNSVLNSNISDLSKVTAVEVKKSDFCSVDEIWLWNRRKHCGKTRKCCLLPFSLSPTVFNALFSESLKPRIVGLSFITFIAQSQLFTTLSKRPFENIVGKGENAGNQHFLLFPPCFLALSSREISISASLKL